MGFRSTIQQHNPELINIPSGYKRYNQVMVLRSSEQLTSELGVTILELYPWCKSVYQHVTTTGESRIPHLRFLAGIDDPVVIHKENSVLYSIDLSKITFSGGNRRLRERLVDQVSHGEFLLDMFAAVGNLSLQPLVHKNISALLTERNPYTFKHLQKSLILNKLPIDIALNSDCRVLDLANKADRIFMGYHGVDQSHLDTAIRAIKNLGYIHLHPLIPWNRKDEELDRIHGLLEKYDIRYSEYDIHKIKTFSPGLDHVEFVFQIFK